MRPSEIDRLVSVLFKIPEYDRDPWLRLLNHLFHVYSSFLQSTIVCLGFPSYSMCLKVVCTGYIDRLCRDLWVIHPFEG